jgi:serine O-acetyltransferase
MNNLCQRLSELDPSFEKESQDEQPFSDEELKILEEVRRECGAQNKISKT